MLDTPKASVRKCEGMHRMHNRPGSEPLELQLAMGCMPQRASENFYDHLKSKHKGPQ